MPHVFSDKEFSYEVPPEEAMVMTEYLLTLRDKLGLPDLLDNSDLNNVSWKYIEAIVHAWKALYPRGASKWISDMKNDLLYERPIREAMKANGGYFPVSYPAKLLGMMRTLLPGLKFQQDSFYKKFLELFPEFKSTNYEI